MRIRALIPLMLAGSLVEVGEEADVPDTHIKRAKRLVDGGSAERLHLTHDDDGGTRPAGADDTAPAGADSTVVDGEAGESTTDAGGSTVENAGGESQAEGTAEVATVKKAAPKKAKK